MAVGAEKIKPYAGDKRHKAEQVREMFDNIAPTYDFMNRAMTLGLDIRWRRRAVRMLRESLPTGPVHLLDIATGTGDLAMMLARSIPQSSIQGVDLSEGMVSVGRTKVEQAGLAPRVSLDIADCLALPYADDTFHGITVAFGVRNFEHLAEGYREMQRVMKPGGTLCVIEMSTPTGALVRPLYRMYAHHIIPAVGKLISHDSSAYHYLPESIAVVPQGEQMLRLIRDAGFADASTRTMMFGVCSIYMARKPE